VLRRDATPSVIGLYVPGEEFDRDFGRHFFASVDDFLGGGGLAVRIDVDAYAAPGHLIGTRPQQSHALLEIVAAVRTLKFN
jgi:hypothetical protein